MNFRMINFSKKLEILLHGRGLDSVDGAAAAVSRSFQHFPLTSNRFSPIYHLLFLIYLLTQPCMFHSTSRGGAGALRLHAGELHRGGGWICVLNFAYRLDKAL